LAGLGLVAVVVVAAVPSANVLEGHVLLAALASGLPEAVQLERQQHPVDHSELYEHLANNIVRIVSWLR